MIAGPVSDHGDVEVYLFTKATVVESVSSLPSREVYVREVPTLVKKGLYLFVAVAFESAPYVTTMQGDSGRDTKEPSWPNDSAEVLPVRRVLEGAAVAMKRSGGRVANGNVKFVSSVPLSAHPLYAYVIRL